MSRMSVSQLQLSGWNVVGAADLLAGLNAERFDSRWRAEASVRECSIGETGSFVNLHYPKSRPAVCVLCFKMFVRQIPVGIVIYALPPPESAIRYGGTTWELARLYLIDECPKNSESWLISQSVRHIKRHYPQVVHLLSYADPSAGHRGTIYRAANWKEDGMTDEGRKARCDYYDARDGRKYARRNHIQAGAAIERKARISKYRFVLTL